MAFIPVCPAAAIKYLCCTLPVVVPEYKHEKILKLLPIPGLIMSASLKEIRIAERSICIKTVILKQVLVLLPHDQQLVTLPLEVRVVDILWMQQSMKFGLIIARSPELKLLPSTIGRPGRWGIGRWMKIRERVQVQLKIPQATTIM